MTNKYTYSSKFTDAQINQLAKIVFGKRADKCSIKGIILLETKLKEINNK